VEIKRVAAVTGGLIMAGAIAGGVASAIAIVAVGLVSDGSMGMYHDPETIILGGILGAIYGAVLGPLAAWLLMRHVPLGIAIGGTMLGTLIGGVAALMTEQHFLSLPLAGFALAALVIRLAVPRPARVRVQG
jgi:hypothetical protein